MKVFLSVGVALLGLALVPAQPASAVACPLQIGQAYRTPNNPAVFYISEECKKRPMKNPDIFFSYFHDWAVVRQVSDAELSAVPNHELGFLPWGPERTYENGSLIKTTSDPRVYLKIEEDIYPIGSEEAFRDAGLEWSWIEDVDPRVIARYARRDIISTIADYPERMAFKYRNNPRVYLLEKDDLATKRKRHIASETAFRSLGYRMDRIATFPDSFSIDDADGEALSDDNLPVRRIVLRAKDPSESRGRAAEPVRTTESTRRGAEGTPQENQEVSNCQDLRLERAQLFEVCNDQTVVYGNTGISFDIRELSVRADGVSSVLVHLRREGMASEDHELQEGEWLEFTHDGNRHRIRMSRARLVQRQDDGVFFRLDPVGTFDLESE